MADAPEALVRADGKDVVKTLEGELLKVEASLYLEQESRAVIDLSGCYDVAGHSILPDLKNSVKPGNKLEVELGYAGSRSLVFSGFIQAVELEAGEETDYVVRLQGCDAVSLMKGNRRCRIFKEQSYSAVFQAVLSDYSGLCSAKVEDTASLEDLRVWHQNGSDYDFITRELVEEGEEDRQFYVSLGTAYYQPEDPSREAALELKPDSGLLHFRVSLGYVNKTVKVQGCSEGLQLYSGQEEAAAAWMGDFGGKGAQVLLIPSADSQDKAQACAARRARALADSSRTAWITLPGNSALIPGTYVSLAAFDQVINGTYRITEAVHRMDGEGYSTMITLRG